MSVPEFWAFDDVPEEEPSPERDAREAYQIGAAACRAALKAAEARRREEAA